MEVSDTKKQTDIETLFSVNEVVNGIMVDVLGIVDRYDYPKTSRAELEKTFGEVSNQLRRALSHIINPNAPEIVDSVRERIRCGID